MEYPWNDEGGIDPVREFGWVEEVEVHNFYGPWDEMLDRDDDVPLVRFLIARRVLVTRVYCVAEKENYYSKEWVRLHGDISNSCRTHHLMALCTLMFDKANSKPFTRDIKSRFKCITIK